MDIGIIGSGHIGSTLARHLAALGHWVSIANSRGPASLATLAADIGATAATVEQAARARDIVIIIAPSTSSPLCDLASQPRNRRFGVRFSQATEVPLIHDLRGSHDVRNDAPRFLHINNSDDKPLMSSGTRPEPKV